MHIQRIQIVILAISSVALLVGAFLIYAVMNLQSSVADLRNDLATIEVKVLVHDCASITWDTEPQPNSPSQSIEYINKCIHRNASLQKTKQLIEDSNWSYWFGEVGMPGDIQDASINIFKHPMYPDIKEL